MKHLKNKTLFTMTITMAMAVAAAGCSTESGGETTSEAPKASTAPTPEVRKDITVTTYDTGRVTQEEGTNEQNRWTKWINENGPANVKFSAISFAQFKEKTNVNYASGAAPDLLMVFDPTIRNPLYDQKQLMPLDDLIAKNSTVYKKLLEENPLLRKAGTKPDGKLYEIGHIQWVNPLRGVMIRTDWLKKLNLKSPTTTEELYQVAKAFAEQDPDGNGKKDTYGIALSGSAEYTINQMFYAIKPWVVKDGKLVYSWENIKGANDFKRKLFQEGIVDKDFFNDKNMAKAKQDFITGKLGIFTPNFNSPQDLVLQYLDPLQKNVPDATFTLIPFPKSPYGQFTPTLENPVQMTGAISSTSKSPEAVMKYIDFMAQDSTANVLDNGLDGVHTKVVDGCPQIIDAAKFKKEVTDITVFMKMLTNTGLRFDKCATPAVMYNNDPRVQDYYQLLRDVYLNFDIPYAELTHSEHMPQLPKDLATIVTNTDKQVNSMVGASNGTIWAKSIIDVNYTSEQAMKDAIDVWDKAGGKKVEEWMASWYAAEKDKAFLAKDMYEIAKQQDAKYKKIMSELKK
jgi:putative aldouronate transport system substrate-binding protein